MSEDGKERFMQLGEEEGPPGLELGLGLGPCTGICRCIQVGKRSHRARILTAQDLSSSCAHVSPTSARCSDSVNSLRVVSPLSVPDDFLTPDSLDGSAVIDSENSSQVVGWPPIRAYRMNSLVNNISKSSRAEDDEKSAVADTKSSKNGREDKVYEGATEVNAAVEEGGRVRFVKVYMDGVPIGRKVDLNAHSRYETLAQALADMFLQRPERDNLRGVGAKGPSNRSSTSLPDDLSEFVLTYEDKEGDWMLVGDVPWGMFLATVRRLKIMRTGEAKGLGSE